MRLSRLARTSSFVAVAAVVGLLVSSPAAVAAGTPGGANYQKLPASIRHDIATVPTSTLATIGSGKPKGHANTAPRLTKQPALSKHGKPEVAYIIGEFCPYCAGESWSVAVALSRFGHLHGLTTLTSSATDRPASIQTLSFRYSTYTSRYLDYDPITNEDVMNRHVQTVPTPIRKQWKADSPGGFVGYPFIDVGGKVALVGPTFAPTLLHGLTRAQIAADLAHPNSPVAQAIDGGANQLTAALCLVTKNRPGHVCKKGGIPAIEKSLKPLRKRN